MGVGDTVYMLDADGKQLWKYKNAVLTTEPAYSSARDEVAVVMYDLQAVRLDATTGKVKWKAESAGKGLYLSVSAYDQGFVVVVDMAGYRQRGSHLPPDQLEYWGKSNNDSWSVDFPQGAELVVSGNKIYALRRSGEQVRMLEIQPSASKKPQ